jgi:hypothetical protein
MTAHRTKLPVTKMRKNTKTLLANKLSELKRPCTVPPVQTSARVIMNDEVWYLQSTTNEILGHVLTSCFSSSQLSE